MDGLLGVADLDVAGVAIVKEALEDFMSCDSDELPANEEAVGD